MTLVQNRVSFVDTFQNKFIDMTLQDYADCWNRGESRIIERGVCCGGCVQSTREILKATPIFPVLDLLPYPCTSQGSLMVCLCVLCLRTGVCVVAMVMIRLK